MTRQAVPTLDRNVFSSAEGLKNGAYVLADFGEGKEPEIILMASGSEVSLIVAAGQKLAEENHCVRLVSFPSWELFKNTSKSYQNSVLPEQVKNRLAVEMGIAQGWCDWTGDEGEVLSIEQFGASAPYKDIVEQFGFTVENVYNRARKLLDKKR